MSGLLQVLLDKLREPSTVKPFSSDIEQALCYRNIVMSKPSVRLIYENYYRIMKEHLASVDTDYPTVEFGSGSGFIKEIYPEVITTDILDLPHVDKCMDARNPSFDKESIGNIVFLDMLHHIDKPYEFLRKTAQLLVPGGRMVFIEPYVNICSWFLYKFVHAEKKFFDMDSKKREWEFENHLLDANTAIPTILFVKNLDVTGKNFPCGISLR